ncbi:GatB/YqeY domain-containing protein, partial [Mycobacterium sp. 852002-51163_SCH5372311]|uniref:GatB/YqeY domain-containing protein n=1 Tax=Mycobacterium sp. 852002-51163_SCH5372311 TaxID=1834097 RepID=UPI003511AA99
MAVSATSATSASVSGVGRYSSMIRASACSLAAIQTAEVSGKQARELSDDEVIQVLAKESRKRGEAAEIYTQNGRGHLAASEHAEARIIDEYQ